MTSNRNVGKNEVDCETSGNGTEKNHVIGDDPTKGWEGVSMPAFQENKEDRTRREPARSESSNKSKRCRSVVIGVHAYNF